MGFDFFNVCSLAGGLALFLYGMNIMGAGLEKLAGSRMESILQSLTKSPLKAVTLGAVVTALIQSSSGTTVIVVGLVNSGIMKLSQAIGVIMGANIGTTVTGQIIRLSDISGSSFLLQMMKPKNFAPLIAFAGVILFVFFKSAKKRNVGQIMVGFGALFIGMTLMEGAVSPLSETPWFAELFSTLQNPLLGILAGTLVTVAIQSSSASLGILQALSSTGVVTWSCAIPIILGQNIGTCSTPMLASIGASKGAKRSAIVHLSFNVIGTLAFTIVLYSVQGLFGLAFWDDVMNMGDIANFHTLFNVVVTLLFLPFTKLLAKIAELVIPDKEGDKDQTVQELPILDERLFASHAVAIQQAKSAVETMASAAQRNYALSVPFLFNYHEDEYTVINQRESLVDRLEVHIGNYLLKLSDRELSENESHVVTELMHYLVEYERIGDYAVSVVSRSGEMYDKKLNFSESAKTELLVLHNAINEIVALTNTAFEQNDKRMATQVEPLEQTIDIMIDTLRAKHINRLKQGICGIETGIIFLEILSNLERISDHCSNIAARIIGASSGEIFDAHEMRRRMHNGLVPDYNKMLETYKEKYLTQLSID